MSITSCYHSVVENLQWLMIIPLKKTKILSMISMICSSYKMQSFPSLISSCIAGPFSLMHPPHWPSLCPSTAPGLLPCEGRWHPLPLPEMLCSQVLGSFLSFKAQLKQPLHRQILPEHVFNVASLPVPATQALTLHSVLVSTSKFFSFIHSFTYSLPTFTHKNSKYREDRIPVEVVYPSVPSTIQQ